MGGLGIIGWIIIGGLAGWIAEKVTKSNHGLLMNIVVGIVGGVLGGFLAGILGLQIVSGWLGSLVIATVGALILLFVLQALKK